MHDRRLARLGLVLGQPRGDAVEHRQLARAVVLPQPAEAAQLAVEVAGRLAVALEPAGAPVDGVDLHQRVDQLLADPRARRSSSSAGGTSAVMHVALHPLHHVERRADHGLVVARGEHARRAHVGVLHGGQQARLAQHVVGRRRQRRARRAAQHPRAAGAADRRTSRSNGPRRRARPRAAPRRGPRASRNASSGRRTSSGGRSSAAACSGVSTMRRHPPAPYPGYRNPGRGDRFRTSTCVYRLIIITLLGLLAVPGPPRRRHARS